MHLAGPFRALAHRNFRLYFTGQAVSLIGTWMQQVATAWLVWLLTGSPRWLGLVNFAALIPAFFLAPLAGVFVDRVNRHRLLVATQSLAMLQAFALAALAFTGAANVWNLTALSLCLGVVNAADMTARQAFLTELVGGRDDLGNAIALNSSVVNGARLVGPALAGLVLAHTSTGVCFLANGVSYLAVLAALVAVRVEPRKATPPPGPVLAGLREGFAYAFGFAPIRAVLLLLALVSMAGMSYSVLLPAVATETLGGGAPMLGWLSASAGVGALGAAAFLAARKSVLGLGKLIALAPGLFGLGLVAFSWCRTPAAALPLLAVCGFAMMLHLAASNTILQTIVEEDKRGRVMSLYTMAFLGVAPLGSLLAGTLAQRFGVETTLRLGGSACLAGSLAFLAAFPRLRTQVRPIYVRMGILPQLDAVLPAEPPGPRAVGTGVES